MKPNKIQHGDRKGVLFLVATIVVAATGLGLVIGFDRLRDLYLEQCIIRDPSVQVSITAGEMVKADVIAENLGLLAGANLALIDFAEKREELLKKVPTLKSVTVTRYLPDRVSVATEERTPIAKLGIRGYRRTTGRVVDSEGMVFTCLRGTQLLPTISEPQAPGTAPGHKIKNRTLAALRLIEACREPEFAELGVQDVDVSKPDFLLATLGDYSKAKISWHEMDESTAASRDALVKRLDQLVKTIRSKVGAGTVIWNATMPDRVFADSQGKF